MFAKRRKRKAEERQRALSILRDILGIVALLLEIALSAIRGTD